MVFIFASYLLAERAERDGGVHFFWFHSSFMYSMHALNTSEYMQNQKVWASSKSSTFSSSILKRDHGTEYNTTVTIFSLSFFHSIPFSQLKVRTEKSQSSSWNGFLFYSLKKTHLPRLPTLVFFSGLPSKVFLNHLHRLYVYIMSRIYYHKSGACYWCLRCFPTKCHRLSCKMVSWWMCRKTVAQVHLHALRMIQKMKITRHHNIAWTFERFVNTTQRLDESAYFIFVMYTNTYRISSIVFDVKLQHSSLAAHIYKMHCIIPSMWPFLLNFN